MYNTSSIIWFKYCATLSSNLIRILTALVQATCYSISTRLAQQLGTTHTTSSTTTNWECVGQCAGTMAVFEWKQTGFRSVFRASSDARFARLWRTRTEIHPLQVCPVRGTDPLNWPARVCLLSKISHYTSAWKSGNGFLLVRHRYHSYDLGSSAMLSAQLYTLCFQTLSFGSENSNVRSHVHYTSRSKSKYYIKIKIPSLPSWLVKG